MTFKKTALVFASIMAVATGCAFRDESGTLPSQPSTPATSAPEQQAAKPNPTGSGESVTTKIDNAKGGEVTLSDGMKIEVPPGALPPGVDAIEVTSHPEPAPAEYESITPKYEFGPEGTVFLKPLKVSIPVTIPAGTDTSTLTVLWSRHGGAPGFDMVPTEFQKGSGDQYTAIAEVNHFSRAFCGRRYTTDPFPPPDPYQSKK